MKRNKIIEDFFNNIPPESWYVKLKRYVKIQLWYWSIEIDHFFKKRAT